ncbi:MAG: carboxypeptidase M32, partial [Candidatus Heimdallarchaeaceae archaeon]
ERDLLNGRIEVEDLPKIWKQKMKEFLNYDVQNDAEGVLQDIHWSDGLMGYFPTYTLGNIFGAQIFSQLKKEIPSWEKEIIEGNLKTILDWFRINVHEKGNLKDSHELVKEISGEEVSSEFLVNYLQEKYKYLYNLD